MVGVIAIVFFDGDLPVGLHPSPLAQHGVVPTVVCETGEEGWHAAEVGRKADEIHGVGDRVSRRGRFVQPWIRAPLYRDGPKDFAAHTWFEERICTCGGLVVDPVACPPAVVARLVAEEAHWSALESARAIVDSRIRPGSRIQLRMNCLAIRQGPFTLLARKPGYALAR